MWNIILKHLKPPVFERDQEKTDLGHILHSILLAILVLLLCALFFIVLFIETQKLLSALITSILLTVTTY